MKPRNLLLTCLLIFTACSKASGTARPEQTPSPPTTPAYPTPLLLPTPTPAYLEPEVVNLCQGNIRREVPLDKLGLPPETLLVMRSLDEDAYPPDSRGIWVLSPKDSAPQYIPLLDYKEGAYYHYTISPDHRWLSFERREEGETGDIMGISSLNGKQKWILAEGDVGDLVWVSDKEMISIGLADKEQWKEEVYEGLLPSFILVPLFSINPFTRERQDFVPVPIPEESPVFSRDFLWFFRQGEKMYGVAVINYRSDELTLYNLSDGSSQPAFQWLNDNWDFVSGNIWLSSDGTFTVAAMRPYGLDLASDLDLQTILHQKNYDDVMRKILLPVWMREPLPFRPAAALPEKHLLLLRQNVTIGDHRYLEGSDLLYLLDYQNMVVKNYCFIITPNERAHFSPDGRFLAITSAFEEEDSDNWTIILNLETGYLSFIPNFQLIGWGITDNND